MSNFDLKENKGNKQTKNELLTTCFLAAEI